MAISPIAASVWQVVAKRFGDSPASRDAFARAVAKADQAGNTSEAWQSALVEEFASFVGDQPDIQPATRLSNAAKTVSGPAPEIPQDAGGAHLNIPGGPENSPKGAGGPQQPPPLPPQIPPTSQNSGSQGAGGPQQPPPLPATTQRLADSLTAVSTPSTGASGPQQPPPLPVALAALAAGAGAGGAQNQPDWDAIGKRIGEHVRAALEGLFQRQLAGQGGSQGAGGPQNPLAPGTGPRQLPMTLQSILMRVANKVPKSLRPRATALVRSFAKSSFGKLARRATVALAKTKVGRRAVKAVGSRVAGAGLGRAGAMLGGRAGAALGAIGGPVGMALGAILGTMAGSALGGGDGGAGGQKGGKGILGKVIDFARPTGNPRGGYLDRATDIVPGAKPVKDFAKAISDATDRLVSWNRQMGEYSASMSLLMAQREFQEIQRSRDIGNRLEPSARGLVESEQRRKDATKEIEIAAAQLENFLTSLLNDGITKLAKIISPGITLLKEMLDMNEHGIEQRVDANALIDQAAEHDRQVRADAKRQLERIRRK